MAVIDDLDLDEMTVIPISKRLHKVEIRNETESALVIYISPVPKREVKGEANEP